MNAEHSRSGRPWVADTLIDWPQDSCLGCRNRVLVGQAWTDVTNGDARARFHRDCEPVWRAEREALARKTIRLPHGAGRWP